MTDERTDASPAGSSKTVGTVRLGDIVDGKYRVAEVIGTGRVGVVVAAENIELGERVALKFLDPGLLESDVAARFIVEAKAASNIKSEYVASVHEVGTLPTGGPYFVMEYLEGKHLGAVIEATGRLGRREATEYAMQACAALASAHARGIVHRNIKPSNLVLTSRAGMKCVKVSDFVNVIGSPLYMSPEQVRSSASVDMRSDIWSLGTVLYEMLSGVAPFKRASPNEISQAILEAAPAPIAEHGLDLPPGYADVLVKCLAKDPAERFQNVAELALALLPFAPRRARIYAERAVRALETAGLIEEASVRFSSVPPAPGGSSMPTRGPSLDVPDESGSGSPLVMLGGLLEKEVQRAPAVPRLTEPPVVASPAPRLAEPAVVAPPAPRLAEPAVVAPPAPRVVEPAVVAPPAPRVVAPAVVAPPAPRVVEPAVVASVAVAPAIDDVSDVDASPTGEARRTRVLTVGAVALILASGLVLGLVTLRTAAPKPSTPLVAQVSQPVATSALPVAPNAVDAPVPARVTPVVASSTTRPAQVGPTPIPVRPRMPVARSYAGEPAPPPDVRVPPVAASGEAPSGRKADCTPPFYFEGTKKVFKPECL